MNPQNTNQNNPNAGLANGTTGSYNPQTTALTFTTPTGNGQSLGLSSPNATVVNNTPVNNIPNASSLGQTPVVIPPTPTGTSQSANQAIGSSQGALLGLQNQNLQAQQNAFQQSETQTQGLINQYLGKGQDQLNMENAAGVPQLQALSNSLNNQYLTQGAAYNSQYNDILNNPNITREQATKAISDLQQQHGYDLTNTAIQASIASTNYSNAATIINHQIDLKYAPVKDAIDFGIQFMQQNKDLLSQAQTQQFNAQLQVQQQTYNQGVYNDHLVKDTQVQIIKDAAALGTSPDVLNQMGQIMAQGGTIGDVASVPGAKLGSQTQYTPVQTGFDPNTGLPIYSGFNTKTGQLEVKNGGNILGTTGSSQTTVTGGNGESYQMGSSTTMGAYASATQIQVNNINATVAKVNSTVGNITTPISAQTAINSVAPNSPITGQMIMNSSQKYGVDPATLIGVMQAETQLGTDGSAGAKQNNWGNVGNTDIKMKTGQSVPMATPQAGVDAVAQNLAQRKVQTGQNDPAQPSSQPLTPQQIAAQTIKNAPTFLQPAMQTSVATGAVYIDSSKVPESMKIIAQNYSAGTKGLVPILNADQVSVVNGADEAIRNITDIMAPAWNDIAPQSSLGKIGLQTESIFGNILDTDKNAAIKTFISNRENLAQQIRALSQSAPKGSLLATAESALPDMSGYGFHLIPGVIDTAKVGNAKMQRTLDLLNETIKTFLPNATPATLKPQGTGTPITAPDGRQIIITD